VQFPAFKTGLQLCSFDLELPTQIRFTLKIFAKRFYITRVYMSRLRI